MAKKDNGKRIFKVGDELYRFVFHFDSGSVERRVLVIDSVQAMQVRYTYETATGKAIAYLTFSNLETVTTKGSAKYVVLAEDDIRKAKKLVSGVLQTRKDDLMKQLEAIEGNLLKIERMDIQ